MDKKNVRLLLDLNPQRLKRAHRVQTIFPAAVAGQSAFSLSQRREDDRAMRHGLIAGHRNGPCERAAWSDRQ
jgi:hypothetical protein